MSFLPWGARLLSGAHSLPILFLLLGSLEARDSSANSDNHLTWNSNGCPFLLGYCYSTVFNLCVLNWSPQQDPRCVTAFQKSIVKKQLLECGVSWQQRLRGWLAQICPDPFAGLLGQYLQQDPLASLLSQYLQHTRWSLLDQ